MNKAILSLSAKTLLMNLESADHNISCIKMITVVYCIKLTPNMMTLVMLHSLNYMINLITKVIVL